ncbi:hypothetical protein [Limnohabitans sp. DM1]|nr:hypothetical protein [Limnohabitans sp. DM1]
MTSKPEEQIISNTLYLSHEVGQRISTKTPPKELALARKRMKEWKDVDA